MSVAKFHVYVDGPLGRVYVSKIDPVPPHVRAVEWTPEVRRAKSFGHPSALAVARRNCGRVAVDYRTEPGVNVPATRDTLNGE